MIMEVGTVYGGYYGAKGYEGVRNEEKRADPEYEKKILDALAKNKAVDFGGNIPVVAYTHIDDTYRNAMAIRRA